MDGERLPLIEISIGEGVLSAEKKVRLARIITETVVKEAKQPKEYTWVVFHEVPIENWIIGGLTIPEIKAKMAKK